MRLFVQIPCLNEEGHVAEAVRSIPREVPGFDEVRVLVIDDGSDDATAAKAHEAGADHVVRNPVNHGLAFTYLRGLEECLARGADVIVNYDADSQYVAEDIAALTEPILDGRAELVVGARPISEIEHFSPAKKLFQKLGSFVVRRMSGVLVEDAPSGFRAISRRAAARLYVFSPYTYTLETLIQAGRSNIPVVSVPVRVNPPVRPSRLVRSTAGYIFRSAGTIIRITFLYSPFRVLLWLAVVIGLPGVIAIARFLYFYARGDGSGHVQSLVLGSGMVGMAAVLVIGGMLADLLASNRKLLQDIRARLVEDRIGRDSGD